MQVKVTNVIRTPRTINGYSIYKIIIDKDIDTVVDDKLVKTNGFSITGYSIMKYNININNLINRVKNDNVEEVIVVLKPSIEGETTMQYIKKVLSSYPVKVSKIPIGIPMGTDIEYIDLMTLEMAFEDRKDIS